MGYLHIARFVVLGNWHNSGVDRQSAQGPEGQAQLAFPSEICFGRGPVAQGGIQTRRRDGSAEAVFAWFKQVP